MSYNRALYRKAKRSHRGLKYVSIAFVAILIAYGCMRFSSLEGSIDIDHDLHINTHTSDIGGFQKKLRTFAEENDLLLSQWPEDLVERADRNPELEDFVLNYPLKKDEYHEINLEEYDNTDSVPLLLQWDERWGYSEYSGGIMGLTGCGPTCLSMVCIYLLNEPEYNPRYIAQFSSDNGYSVSGSGSAWALISEGGRELGLDVTEIPLDEDRIIRNLEVGNPIICIMGPGDFTTTGHFIVMTDYVDGMIKVNDPNSTLNSETLWDYAQIEDQILNLWVCR